MPVRVVCPECGATTVNEDSTQPAAECHQCGKALTAPGAKAIAPPPLPKRAATQVESSATRSSGVVEKGNGKADGRPTVGRSRDDKDDEDWVAGAPRSATARDDDDDELDDQGRPRVGRDDDDDRPRRRSSRDDDDEDDDDRPRRGRASRDDDEDDEEEGPPARGRASRDDDEEEEDRPRRGRASRDDDEDDEDDRPRRGRTSRDDDEEEEDRPRRGRASRDDDEDDEDDRPRRTRASRDDDEDDEDDRPRRGRASRDDDDEDEDERPRRGQASRDDDEEEDDDRPRRSRASRDDDEDERPRRVRASREEDEDDADDDEEESERTSATSEDEKGEISDEEAKRIAKALTEDLLKHVDMSESSRDDDEDDDDEEEPRPRRALARQAEEDDDEEDDEARPRRALARQADEDEDDRDYDDDDDDDRPRRRPRSRSKSVVLVLGLFAFLLLGAGGGAAAYFFWPKDDATTVATNKDNSPPVNDVLDIPPRMVEADDKDPKKNNVVEAKPKDNKVVESKPKDTKVVEAKPKDTKIAEAKPKDTKPPVVVAKPKLVQPAASRLPIAPATMSTSHVEVDLPGQAREVCVGGGGRFLIFHCPTARKLAVFDTSALKVVKTITLGADEVLFAAGMNKLLVVYPGAGEKLIVRYDLTTFAPEIDSPLVAVQKPTDAAMGSATAGPLVLGGVPAQGNASKMSLMFLDVDTLAEVPIEKADGDFKVTFGAAAHLRVSADGRTLAAWYDQLQPSGIQIARLDGNTITGAYRAESVGHVTPGPDGQFVFTQGGMFTTKADPVARRETVIPALHGGAYLSVASGSAARAVTVWEPGREGAVATFDSLPGFDGKRDPFERNNPNFALDERLFLVPDARVLVVIPPSADKVHVYKVDWPK